MSDNKKTPPPKPAKKQAVNRRLTESVNLPPTKLAIPMPRVQPPKKAAPTTKPSKPAKSAGKSGGKDA